MIKRIKANWYWFLIGIMVTSVLVYIGISIRCKPTIRERIFYYIAASNVDTSTLVKESKSVCDEDIREIRINHENLKASSSSGLFGMVYSLTDIYIYPESQLERTIPLSTHFEKEEINNLLPNSEGKELYQDDDKYCAIKIYDKNTEEGFLKEIIDYQISENEKEDYYLSFYRSSLHIGELNHQVSNNALKIVNHLLEL